MELKLEPVTIGNTSVDIKNAQQSEKDIQFIDQKISTPDTFLKSLSPTNNQNLQLLNQANLNQSLDLTAKVSNNQYLNNTISNLDKSRTNFTFDLAKQIEGIKNAKDTELSDFQKTQLITNYQQVQNDIQNNLDKLQTQNSSLISSIKQGADDALFLGRLQTQNFGADIDISTRNLSNVADSIKVGEKQLVEVQQKFNQAIKDIYTAGQQAASQLASQAVQYENTNKSFEEQKYQNALANQKYIDQTLSQSFGKLYMSEVSRAKDATGNYKVTPIAKGDNYTMVGADSLLALKDRKFKLEEYTDPTNVAYRDTLNKLAIQQAKANVKATETNIAINQGKVSGGNNTNNETKSIGDFIAFSDYEKNQKTIDQYRNEKDENKKKNLEADYQNAIKQNKKMLDNLGILAYAKVDKKVDEKGKAKVTSLQFNKDNLDLFGVFSGSQSDYFNQSNKDNIKNYFSNNGIDIDDTTINNYFKSAEDGITQSIFNPEADGKNISKFVLSSQDKKSLAIFARNISNQGDKSYKGIVLSVNDKVEGYSESKLDKFIEEVNRIDSKGDNIEPLLNIIKKPEYSFIKRTDGDGGLTALNSDLSTIFKSAKDKGISFERKILPDMNIADIIKSANVFTGMPDNLRKSLKSEYNNINMADTQLYGELSTDITNIKNTYSTKITEAAKALELIGDNGQKKNPNSAFDLNSHIDYLLKIGDNNLNAGIVKQNNENGQDPNIIAFNNYIGALLYNNNGYFDYNNKGNKGNITLLKDKGLLKQDGSNFILNNDTGQVSESNNFGTDGKPKTTLVDRIKSIKDILNNKEYQNNKKQFLNSYRTSGINDLEKSIIQGIFS